jgi:LmbE family N-acetylglucosaminyl deacetylase
MKNKRFAIFLVIILALSVAYSAWASLPSLPHLKDNDRILILAPHPDDETIGAAGVIQEAAKRKLPIKVVYLTNGDNNELAFLVYKKYPVLTSKAILKMGEVRRSEAVGAMQHLGLKLDNLVFLGYPDFGTLRMFIYYWGNSPAFKSMLTRVKAVPYKECYTPGAPYIGESVLHDLESVLKDFQPTKIFVTNPVDANADHRAAFLFLQVALWDLEKTIRPQVYPFVIHAVKWPAPRGFHPDLPLEPSTQLAKSDIQWSIFNLAKEQTQRKKEAIAYYKSQIAYNPPYLYSFARRNELFGAYPDIVLPNHKGQAIDWQTLEGKQNITGSNQGQGRNLVEGMTYAHDGEFLYIKMRLKDWEDELLGINLYLLGYRDDVAFGRMPKYRIHVSFLKFGKTIGVFEKRRRVVIPNIKTEIIDDGIIIGFPLSSLNSPKHVLSNIRTHVKNSPVDITAWRTLDIQ